MPRARFLGAVCALAAALSSSTALAQKTLTYPTGEFVPFTLDSGPRSNPTNDFQLVFSEPITVHNGAWIRVYFSELTLVGDSYIQITSALDAESQKLDAAAAVMWSNSSAYLNGDLVLIELFAAPGTTGNRVSVRQVASQPAIEPAGGPGQCGICNTDDRTPSTEPRAGRLMPVGCSASVFCENGALITAGHCLGSNLVMQFNVPASSGGCALNNPPIADQFPITSTTGLNAGVGADWGVLTTGNNNLGQSIYQRYGVLWRVAPLPAPNGSVSSFWGYGADLTCVRNQTQQFSPGSIIGVGGANYEFNNDVRGGNSGSGLVVNNQLVGVVTHCSNACVNYGTRADRSDFRAARDNVCPRAWQLTIQSSPSNNVPISVTPADLNSLSNGNTPFNRSYFAGSTVTLTAPDTAGPNCFTRWLKNGSLLSTDNRIIITVNAADIYTAQFSSSACCPADFNRDGTLDFFDYLDFVQAFDAESPSADFNHDNTVDFFDYLDFAQAFDAGCN
jgi:hypothetical protein